MNGDGSPLMTEARNERDGRPLINNLPINGLCPLQACQHPHNNEELLSLSCTCGLCGDGMVIDTSPATECSNDNEVLSLGNAIQQKIDKHSHCFSGRRQKFIKTKHHLIGACVKDGVRCQPPNIDKKAVKLGKDGVSCLEVVNNAISPMQQRRPLLLRFGLKVKLKNILIYSTNKGHST